MAKYSNLLTSSELEWVKLQPLLLENGFRLRPRYHPSWKPSWKRPWNFYKLQIDCEDSIALEWRSVIDAVRIKDGLKVAIKRTIFEHDNIPLLQHLNSVEMRADSRNNTVPLLDVIPVPKSDQDSDSKHTVLLVMPMLFPMVSPYFPFLNVKEVTNALSQIFHGVEFLHDNGIAHRDACMLNFMMDPTDVIPGGFHHSKQCAKPNGKPFINIRDRSTVPSIKYYIIDFETAAYFPPNSLVTARCGQEKAAPEFFNAVPYDPFKLDIYQLGMVVHRLIEKYEGLNVLSPLRDAMINSEPKSRPNISESIRILCDLVSALEEVDLSQNIRGRKVFYNGRRRSSIRTVPVQSKSTSPSQFSRPQNLASLCKRGLSNTKAAFLFVHHKDHR